MLKGLLGWLIWIYPFQKHEDHAAIDGIESVESRMKDWNELGILVHS